jgi:elongation factor 3
LFIDYFELSSTDLKFVFPDPGRLEGVRTSTQKFLEMENVDYRYPGAQVNTLNDVTLKMSLSSRVAVIGANGSGMLQSLHVVVVLQYRFTHMIILTACFSK